MTKPIYILGTGLSHDGSTCLLRDGKIIVALEKERITKVKHDGFNDNLTIQYCLDAAGITFKDLTLVVQECTANPILKPEEVIKRSSRIIPQEMSVVNISHHIAHAYSAVGTSPFHEMGVVVMDGQGSSLDTCIDVDDPKILPKDIRALKTDEKYLYWEKESYYSFENGKLRPVFKDFSKFIKWDRLCYPVAPFDIEHSIAEFYGGISYYVFDDEFCEGKLMGLAPYGRPRIFEFDVFEFKEGRVFLKYDWMKNIDPFLGGKYRCFSEYFQYYADLAYFAQEQIEAAIIYVFNAYHDKYSHKNVGYAGGLALNAVANAKLFKNTKFENFYFQPAAGDNGLAIGCCYYGWIEVLKKEKIQHNGLTYFGKQYNNTEININFDKYKDKIEVIRTNQFVKKAAKLLAEGKVLGWFQGGSEFGPRALGHRSILADPRRKDIRNFVNKRVKSREDFRPFAPSVLVEDVAIYFDCHDESPYMILTAQTKDKWIEKLAGVVHIDGSARIQTVSRDINPQYYSLIEEFKAITDISVLLNTSFNGREMPIVETPQDAIDFFVKSKAMDVLVIEDYILIKKVNVNKEELCEVGLHVVTIE